MALAPIQQISTPFEEYDGWWLKAYAQGTTTPIVMATDSTGTTTVAKAEISSGGTVPEGFIKTAGDVIFIPYIDEAYDLWLFPTSADADANDTTNAIQLADNIDFFQNLFSDTVTVKNTVAEMIADADIVLGDLVSTIEHTTGYGVEGGNLYQAVAAGSGTQTSGDYFDSTGNPAIEFKALFPNEVNSKHFGCAADGIIDDDTGLTDFLAYLDSGNFEGTISGRGKGVLAEGKHLYTTTKTVKAGTTVEGVSRRSVFLPSIAGSTGVVMQTGSSLSNLVISGASATGANIGLDVGVTAFSSNVYCTRVFVVGFATTGSIGLSVEESVYVYLNECWFTDNYYGAFTYLANSTTSPSVVSFIQCEFKSNENRGFWGQGGSNASFYDCNFELNGEDGIYLNSTPGVGTAITQFKFEGCWIEANKQNYTQGATRNAEYQVFNNGTYTSFRNCHFFGNTNEAKAIDNVGVDVVVDNCDLPNQAAQIKNSNAGTMRFLNWPTSNGTWETTVDNTSTGNARWTDTDYGTYDPGITFDTPGDLSVAYTANKAYWNRTGNMVAINFFILTSTFTHTTASGNLQVDLGPFTVSGKLDYLASGSVAWSGITKSGYSDICARALGNATDMEFRASGSGVATAFVTATDCPTGGTMRLEGTITLEVANA